MIPTWIIVIDYVLGMIMWTLIGRAAMNIFQREDSNFFFMRMFVKFTNPVLKVFNKITPEFLARPIVPLYVAFYFYLKALNRFEKNSAGQTDPRPVGLGPRRTLL